MNIVIVITSLYLYIVVCYHVLCSVVWVVLIIFRYIILHGGSVVIKPRMAQIRLQTPDAFNFKEPEEWPRWKRRFEQFRVASGLKGEDAEKQVSTLLYCLGEEAEAVLASTNITDEERKVYDTVLKKFDDFFKVRKNVIFERARFNRFK